MTKWPVFDMKAMGAAWIIYIASYRKQEGSLTEIIDGKRVVKKQVIITVVGNSTIHRNK